MHRNSTATLVSCVRSELDCLVAAIAPRRRARAGGEADHPSGRRPISAQNVLLSGVWNTRAGREPPRTGVIKHKPKMPKRTRPKKTISIELCESMRAFKLTHQRIHNHNLNYLLPSTHVSHVITKIIPNYHDML